MKGRLNAVAAMVLFYHPLLLLFSSQTLGAAAAGPVVYLDDRVLAGCAIYQTTFSIWTTCDF
jgi:hypothetical protein